MLCNTERTKLTDAGTASKLTQLLNAKHEEVLPSGHEARDSAKGPLAATGPKTRGKWDLSGDGKDTMGGGVRR